VMLSDLHALWNPEQVKCIYCADCHILCQQETTRPIDNELLTGSHY